MVLKPDVPQFIGGGQVHNNKLTKIGAGAQATSEATWHLSCIQDLGEGGKVRGLLPVSCTSSGH